MQVTPLVTLAKLRIPAFTDLFADGLPVASMAVVAGGVTTLTCSSPHGIAVGTQDWVSITDALAPNPITALVALSGSDIQVTVQYPHNLSATVDNRFEQYTGFATLTVPGVAALNGAIQLVSVVDGLNFVVRHAPGILPLPDSVPSGSVLLESLEIEIVGLNTVTAVSATVLTMPTPTTVARSYTITSPRVARNLRIFGAVDYAHAVQHYTDDNPVPGRCYMFIAPVHTARMSRDWQSTSDALIEWSPNAQFRAKLIDGFEIYVIIATQSMAAAVGAMDTAATECLRAIMQTFSGILIPFSEFAGKGRYGAMMLSHGWQSYTKAAYAHRYSFEAIVQLTAGDVALPYATPDLGAVSYPAIVDPSMPIPPGGTVPAAYLVVDGIRHDSPDTQPLTAIVPLDTATP